MPHDGDFVTLKNIKDARYALRSTGSLLLERLYSRQACNEIVAWIDSCDGEQSAERNYGNSELRIWDSHKRSARLSEFLVQCDVFMSCLLKADTQAHTLLAIRNRPVSQGDDASLDGRWHIDSFRKQLKIFLFLSDVGEETGCFEFIPGTHEPTFKARMAVAGVYFRPHDLISGTRAYSRLDDSWVNRISDQGLRPVPVVCSAGTIMIVDTSAVHRARPCLEGSRYALTAYYR